MSYLFDISKHSRINNEVAVLFSSDFQTPINVGKYMSSMIKRGAKTILEPTPGIGNLVAALDGYDVTAPKDFFLLEKKRFDCVVMNPPFNSKFAFLDNAPPNVDISGMRIACYVPEGNGIQSSTANIV